MTTISRITDLLLVFGLLHRCNFIDISEEAVRKGFERACNYVWKALRVLYPLLVWDKPLDSILLLFCSLLVSQLGKWVTYESGALVILLLVFTLPAPFKNIISFLRRKIDKLTKGIFSAKGSTESPVEVRRKKKLWTKVS